MSGVIYPTFPLISFRVGLISTRSFDAGDVALWRTLDQANRSIDARRSNGRVDHRRSSHMCSNRRRYNGSDVTMADHIGAVRS